LQISLLKTADNKHPALGKVPVTFFGIPSHLTKGPNATKCPRSSCTMILRFAL
jgi:hypothetical protein